MATGSKGKPGDVQGPPSSRHSRTWRWQAGGRGRTGPGSALGLRAQGKATGCDPRSPQERRSSSRHLQRPEEQKGHKTREGTRAWVPLASAQLMVLESLQEAWLTALCVLSKSRPFLPPSSMPTLFFPSRGCAAALLAFPQMSGPVWSLTSTCAARGHVLDGPLQDCSVSHRQAQGGGLGDTGQMVCVPEVCLTCVRCQYQAARPHLSCLDALCQRSFIFYIFFFFLAEPHGMRDCDPDQGSNSCPLHWKHRVLTLHAGPAQEGELPLSLHHLTTAFYFFHFLFIFIQLLKVMLHLQLLQNTVHIPHVVQYSLVASQLLFNNICLVHFFKKRNTFLVLKTRKTVKSSRDFSDIT